MPWQWYLERAAKTSLRFSCETGVMDGTVFHEVLKALEAEGTLNATFAAWAKQLDSHMRARQQHWATHRFPCHSTETNGLFFLALILQSFGEEIYSSGQIWLRVCLRHHGTRRSGGVEPLLQRHSVG